MKVLWLCGLPRKVQDEAFNGRDLGATAAWSWILGHLPPPEGVELHIACPVKHIEHEIAAEYGGAHFHLFPYVKGSAYLLFRNWYAGFRRVFTQVKPDWVHGWGTEAGFSSAAMRLAPERSIVEIQGILLDYHPYLNNTLALKMSMLNEWFTLKKAVRVLAESKYSASEAEKYTSAKIEVIPHPLRHDFLQADFGEHREKQIVFLGELSERKGIKDAISAFSRAKENGWTLICVGLGSQAYFEEVELLIDSLNLKSDVELRGSCSSVEIIRLLQESAVFLLPTYMDTGPTALKEALAMGLWPVCYDNSGPSELIRHYVYGTLAETGDVGALADCLSSVLKERPWEQKGRMSECVKRVRFDLSRSTIWEQLLVRYNERSWKSR